MNLNLRAEWDTHLKLIKYKNICKTSLHTENSGCAMKPFSITAIMEDTGCSFMPMFNLYACISTHTYLNL